MAQISNMFTSFVTLALLSPFFIQATFGGITCHDLNKEECAFAVSSSGKRCVLEKGVRRSGEEVYKCTTSEIEADKVKDLIESNHCVKDCGLDRGTLGISSDSLLEPRFTQKLCSPQCYKNCPNVIDLYFNLAAGEGVFLPKLCATQAKNPRRGMSEIKSSGIAAPGPATKPVELLGAPSPYTTEPGYVIGVATPTMSPISPISYATAPGYDIEGAPAMSPIVVAYASEPGYDVEGLTPAVSPPAPVAYATAPGYDIEGVPAISPTVVAYAPEPGYDIEGLTPAASPLAPVAYAPEPSYDIEGAPALSPDDPISYATAPGYDIEGVPTISPTPYAYAPEPGYDIEFAPALSPYY